jgi:hypothetical protein
MDKIKWKKIKIKIKIKYLTVNSNNFNNMITKIDMQTF